jgi:hypothetical protein
MERMARMTHAAHGPHEVRRACAGDARWDVRMTAWLLWVAAECVDSPVWSGYLASLPPAGEVRGVRGRNV